MNYYRQGLDGELLLCRTRWPRFSSYILFEIHTLGKVIRTLEKRSPPPKSDPSTPPFTVVILKSAMFMKRKSRLLYREMLLRIGSHLKPGYSEKQWIEKAFHVSYQSFSRLLEAAKDHSFADEQERI